MKRLICAVLMACMLCSLVGCQEKKTLPQPEFPLSEEALTTALEETGLSWSVGQKIEEERYTIYAMHRPEDRADYNGVSIGTYNYEEIGRRLFITYLEPQNRELAAEDQPSASWSDLEEILVLIARLFGGFADAEEIYRACSSEDLPLNANFLWEGIIAGRYFYITTQRHMNPDRFFKGNRIVFAMYESKDAYLQYRQMVESSKS